MACKCGIKSGCKTRRCACKKNGKKCDSTCDCNSFNCENREVIKIYSSSNRAYNQNPVDLLDLSSGLTRKIRLSGVSKKRNEVIEYRNGCDIYTDNDAKEYINPHVDHIIEDQILGHASAKVLYQYENKYSFIELLKNALNQIENYNVTLGSLNQSKGSVIRNYLKNERYLIESLPVAALDSSATHFKLFVIKIIPAMRESGDVVMNYIEEVRRSDGHVSGRNCLIEISESVRFIINKMVSNEDSSRLKRRN